MLYHLAKLYDEWEGEDYEGSSCRGAMKGWHRHGACLEKLWPYKDGQFVPPKKDWQVDAATRPLGAYYRINVESISDMQAAIYETGAIFVSAKVHTGWYMKRKKSLPLIKQTNNMEGGHAFAIVGYTDEGFIVQNSWGHDWGYEGFAILSYGDWLENAMDAWVAVIGVPIKGLASSFTYTTQPLQRSNLFGWFKKKKSPKKNIRASSTVAKRSKPF